MTIRHEIEEVVASVKKVVLDNLQQSKERTGTTNPYGDKTLVLDQLAEDTAIEILHSSTYQYAILTEEKGFLKSEEKPELLAILDPIDGSANLERGMPLCSVGISVIPYTDMMTTDDVEISIIDSFFTNETYVAEKGNGVTRNGVRVTPRSEKKPENLMISYDTKKSWVGDFGTSSRQVLEGIHDMRRTGSNLLDLCWTACGSLDAAIDFRNILPIVHVSGTHMVWEAGGYILDKTGDRFVLPIEKDVRMNYIAASNEELAKYLLGLFEK